MGAVCWVTQSYNIYVLWYDATQHYRVVDEMNVLTAPTKQRGVQSCVQLL
jgi:hypothetical protein